jgi:hypothetical protein
MDDISSYYVYLYVCPLTYKIRYVGKGKGKRWCNYSQHAGHCLNWIKSLGSLKPIVVKVYSGLTNDEAVEIEKEFIVTCLDMGCKLTNLTTGGHGSAGYKHSEKSKKLMSDKTKGRIAHNKGVPASQADKLKMSKMRNKTGHLGVGYSARFKRFRARIRVGTTRFELGWFGSAEEASHAINLVTGWG